MQIIIVLYRHRRFLFFSLFFIPDVTLVMVVVMMLIHILIHIIFQLNLLNDGPNAVNHSIQCANAMFNYAFELWWYETEIDCKHSYLYMHRCFVAYCRLPYSTAFLSCGSFPLILILHSISLCTLILSKKKKNYATAIYMQNSYFLACALESIIPMCIITIFIPLQQIASDFNL